MSTWNLDIFQCGTEADFQERLDESRERVVCFCRHWGTDELRSDGRLLEALREYSNIMGQGGTHGAAGRFALLCNRLNVKDDLSQQRLNLATDQGNRLEGQLTAFIGRVSRIDSSRQQRILENSGFRPYHAWLREQWAGASHKLSDELESFYLKKNETAYNRWANLSRDLLAKKQRRMRDEAGTAKQCTMPDLYAFATSADPRVRHDARKRINSAIQSILPVAVAEMNALAEDWRIDCVERKYDRPDRHRLVESMIPAEVMDAMMVAVESRYPICHNFYLLRAALMGSGQINYAERMTPIGNLGTREYTFGQAAEIVLGVLEELHPKLKEHAAWYIQNGCVDVYPKPGKTQAEECFYTCEAYPPFIKLNFKGKIKDVLTLAHELGHALQFSLTRESQIGLNMNCWNATAETFSTFFEGKVLEALLKQLEPEEQLNLLISQIDHAVSNTFRQVACLRFEWNLHAEYREKRNLTSQRLSELFGEQMAAYMGDAVDVDREARNRWVDWPHIRDYFCVSNYPFGLLLSLVFQNRVTQDPREIREFMHFMSVGRSLTPADATASVGVNLTDPKIWQQGIDQIEAMVQAAKLLAVTLGKL